MSDMSTLVLCTAMIEKNLLWRDEASIPFLAHIAKAPAGWLMRRPHLAFISPHL